MSFTLKKITLCFFLIIAFAMVFSTVFALDRNLANDTVTAKHFWFVVAMAVMAIIITVFFITEKTVIVFSLSDILFFVFVMLAAIPYMFCGRNIDTSIVMLLLLAVLYFYFRLVLSSGNNFRKTAIILLIITALLEGIWGLLQLYGFYPSQHSLFRFTGSFFNPGPYAGYISVIMPLALYCSLKKHKNILELIFRIISVFTVIVALLVLPASMSRAAWISALCGSMAVGICFISKKINFKLIFKAKRKIITFASIFVLIILVPTVSEIYNLKKNSADGRILIWKNTAELIRQNPAGVGSGYFGGVYAKIQAEYFKTGKGTEYEKLVAGNPGYTFNEYLQTGAETGIAGLILFLAIIFVALYKNLKHKRTDTFCSLLSLFVFAFFSYPFSVLPFLIVFVFLLADTNTPNLIKTVPVKPFFLFKKNVLLALSLFIVVVCFYNRYPVYNACCEWKNLKILYSMKVYDIADDYERLLPSLFDWSDFMFEYGLCLAKMEHYEKSNRILSAGILRSSDPMFYNIMGGNYQKLKQYGQAEKCYLMAANIVPHRIYPYYLLAKLYAETGNNLKLRQAANLVMTKEPKIHSQAVEEMRKEVQKLID